MKLNITTEQCIEIESLLTELHKAGGEKWVANDFTVRDCLDNNLAATEDYCVDDKKISISITDKGRQFLFDEAYP